MPQQTRITIHSEPEIVITTEAPVTTVTSEPSWELLPPPPASPPPTLNPPVIAPIEPAPLPPVEGEPAEPLV